MLSILIEATKKSQAWYMDFAIALLLFTFTLVVYFSYTNNFQKQEKGELGVLLTDAKALSSSLALPGYPLNWDNITVLRIGIANEQKLNEAKMNYFSRLNYSLTKKRFGTVYDYFVFFEEADNTIINFGTKCGVGSPLINVTKKFKKAAYYDKEQGDMENKIQQLETKFGVDIYKGWGSADEMLDNISKYDFVLIEAPQLSSSHAAQLGSYVNNSGIIFVSGRLLNDNNGVVLGVNYTERGSCGQNATVILDDLFLTLKKDDRFLPDECPYVEGSFIKIAEFPDGKAAIAKWSYGKGTIYYFSDFNADSLASYQQNVADGMEAAMTDCGTEDDIKLNNTKAKRLVKIERYLNYNSQVIKMVVYLWE